MKSRKRKWFVKGPMDKEYLLLALILLGVGLLMLLSANYPSAYFKTGNPYYYFQRQAIFAVAGLLGMLFVSKLDYDQWRHWAVLMLLVSFLLLGAVLVPKIGSLRNNARRWIEFKGVHFQPSEFAKLAMVLFFAYNMSRDPKRNGTFLYGFLPQIAVCGLLAGLIMLQPDLGTAVALVGTAFLMMLSGGIKYRYLITMILCGAVLVAVAIILEPFRMARFTAFLDPWQDAQGYGFQTVQSLIAIGSGGVTGAGLGNGSSKWYYLPEVHTDFIFSLIGEELGLIGTVFTLFLFAVFVWRGLRIAILSEEPFFSLLAMGITAMIGVQTLINFFVATGMMPVTGIALPFISYGGSSLVFTLLATGILLNLSTRLPKGDIG